MWLDTPFCFPPPAAWPRPLNSVRLPFALFFGCILNLPWNGPQNGPSDDTSCNLFGPKLRLWALSPPSYHCSLSLSPSLPHLCLVLGQGRKRRRKRERWGGKCVKTILCKCFSCSCFKCVLPLRSRPKWQRSQQEQQQQQQWKKIRSIRKWRQRIAQVFGAAFIVPVHLEFYLKWIMREEKNPTRDKTRWRRQRRVALIPSQKKRKMKERKRGKP